MKEEKFPNSKKPSHRRVCGEFWNLRRQHDQEGEKKTKPTEYMPNRDCQWRSSPGARVRHQRLDKEAQAASLVLRVRTGPECPKGNLRELT